MYEFDLGSLRNNRSCSDVEVNGLIIKINGVVYTVPDVVMLVQEVEELRKENVALNKDRSALQNINEGLQKQVYNYQDTIANNLTGIRCKELEGEVEQLKQQVSDLEEIIRDVDDFESEFQDQQEIIECLENDIKRLVKLNGKLINECEELKSKQNIVGDYLKGFVATSLSNEFVCGDLSLTVSGYVGETEISITILDKETSTGAVDFVNTLVNKNH